MDCFGTIIRQHVFTDNPESTSFKSDVGDCIDYYFMYGGNADGVIARMRDLTGQVPMFPLWTFGFFQSKERYKSQDEMVDVVKKYRELECRSMALYRTGSIGAIIIYGMRWNF